MLFSLAPIYAVYALQFSRPEATGFIQYDMPYYLANGRKSFDRGGGLLHANPYDPGSAGASDLFSLVNLPSCSSG